MGLAGYTVATFRTTSRSSSSNGCTEATGQGSAHDRADLVAAPTTCSRAERRGGVAARPGRVRIGDACGGPPAPERGHQSLLRHAVELELAVSLAGRRGDRG